jgi:general nucleoside transport system permease protein
MPETTDPSADEPKPDAPAPEGEPPRAAPESWAEPSATRYLWRSIRTPLLAVVAALLVGALLIVFSDDDALGEWAGLFRDPLGALSASWTAISESYAALFTGAFGHPTEIASAIGSGDLDRIQASLAPISEMIVTTTPLIFVGLSVSVGFRAGLFNIGAEGQMNVGAIVAAAVGFSFPGLPGPIHLALVILGGFVGGAMWGAIPGFLKAKTGAHEVITTIMLNFVAVSLVLWLLSTDFFKQQAEPIAKPVIPRFPHLLGTDLRVHLGIVVALLVAAGVAWLLNRTTVGFEFRAVGSNPDAARAAGMSPTAITVSAMTLSGGLAGLAGANQLLSVTPSLLPGFAAGLGFDGIAVALLAGARPAGVVAASFLFGALRAGGRSMQIATQTPIDIVVVIQALVIAFVAAPALVRTMFRMKEVRGEATAFAKGWGG